jgi:hypothetical protein
MSPNKPPDDQQVEVWCNFWNPPSTDFNQGCHDEMEFGSLTFFSCNKGQSFCAYINGVGMWKLQEMMGVEAGDPDALACSEQ